MLNGRTVLEIETRILQRTRMSYKTMAQDYTAATGKVNLRQIVNDCQNRINAFREWPFLVKSVTLTGTGTRILELPNQDFQREIRLVDETNQRQVYIIPFSNFLDRAPSQFGIGSPLIGAFPDQNHIALEPALTSGQTLTLWYIREMQELINDNDIPDVPQSILFPYCRALVECGIIDVLERMNDQRGADRQERGKYPIALKELIRLAGAGDSAVHIRQAQGAWRGPEAYPVMPAAIPST